MSQPENNNSAEGGTALEIKDFFVDLTGVSDKASLHQRLREGLPLPSWYGNNLDALYDALTEMPVPARIHFSAREKAARHLTSYMKGLVRVLADAEKDNPGLSIIFEE